MNKIICCDFHAHILPEIDHGSKSVEMSMQQIKRAKECGVSSIVATPHFYPQHHKIDDFCKLRDISYEKLMAENIDDIPKIMMGAEVLLCDGLDRINGIKKLCIENTNVMLLEIPDSEFTDMMQDTILRLCNQRYINVVIAHPERYSTTITDVLEKMSLPFQINAEGYLGVSTRKRCAKWIEQGKVWAVGSDVHRNENRYSFFVKMKYRMGEEFHKIQEKTRKILNIN